MATAFASPPAFLLSQLSCDLRFAVRNARLITMIILPTFCAGIFVTGGTDGHRVKDSFRGDEGAAVRPATIEIRPRFLLQAFLDVSLDDIRSEYLSTLRSNVYSAAAMCWVVGE